MDTSTDNQDFQLPNPSSITTTTTTQKIKPNLHGSPETLLGMIYMRAMDARSTRPILGDRYAADIVDSIEYNWAKLRLNMSRSAGFALRARLLDRWTLAFVKAAFDDQDEREEEGDGGLTVLHLAAGLDTRVLRILDALDGHGEELTPRKNDNHENESAAHTPILHWIDADLPEVMNLRQRIAFPRPSTSPRIRYEEHAIDVTEPNWLAKLGLSRTRRTMVVMEGLTMYLEPEHGRALVQQLTSYFVSPSSSSSSSSSFAPGDRRSRHQLCFDCESSLYVALQQFDPIVAQTGSRFSWGVDDLHELERWDRETGNGRLRLVEAVSGCDNPETRDLGWLFWLLCWVCSWVPMLRRAVQYARFEW